MNRERRPSAQTLAVLAALSIRPADWLYGLELAGLTNLKSGSLYPILIRLADRGLLESRWLDPIEPGRPVARPTSQGPGGRPGRVPPAARVARMPRRQPERAGSPARASSAAGREMAGKCVLGVQTQQAVHAAKVENRSNSPILRTPRTGDAASTSASEKGRPRSRASAGRPWDVV